MVVVVGFDVAVQHNPGRWRAQSLSGWESPERESLDSGERMGARGILAGWNNTQTLQRTTTNDHCWGRRRRRLAAAKGETKTVKKEVEWWSGGVYLFSKES